MDAFADLFLHFGSPLAWNATAFAEGEYWRAWTPWLVHLSGAHLLANLSAFALIAAALGARHFFSRLVPALLIAQPLANLLLGYAMGPAGDYAGSSVLLWVLLGGFAAEMEGKLRWLLLAAEATYLALSAHGAFESPWPFRVAHEAHAAGFGAGTVAGMLAMPVLRRLTHRRCA